MHVNDDRRLARIGMPEAVFCEPKTPAQLDGIVADLLPGGRPTLFTRLTPERFAALSSASQAQLVYDADSSTATLHGCLPAAASCTIGIVVAGTSDLLVAREAAATLDFSGVPHAMFVDVGVAGLWRLEERLDEIRACDIVIAVAGMDAALMTVLGGLIGAPLIGVPTSVGYGVAEGGTVALGSALASCAQGVAVVNIDNGFGAACAAMRIINQFGERSS
ncbi:MAG: nickel pincer cofactor biosynthesis protein LarB [Actinomycetota bacterium]